MSTAFTWSARLTDADGKPAVGASLDVQLFDLKTNAWAAVSSAKTDADGLARGTGAIADDTLPFAPAFRLVEGAAAMSVSPEFGRAARGGGLTIDFGQVRRLAVEEKVVARTTVAARVLRAGTVITPVGGVIATDSPAARDVADRDKQLADKDAEIATLRSAKVDVAAVRAQAAEETTKTFTARLVQRDQDLADRDRQLADRSRIVTEQQSEITRLRGVVATQETAATQAAAAAAAAQAAAAARPATPGRLGADATGATTATPLRLRSVAVTDLATTMATQLDDAQITLKPRGFSLGAIQVNAKVLLQDAGAVQLIDADTARDLKQDVLSDVKFQFIPEKPADASEGPRAPDVLQLTESAARRVLTSVGLVLEASVGPHALNPAVAPGQAMVQSPTAGSVIARGARVMVIFAAADEQGA